MTPVIGITTYDVEARWGAWEAHAALLPFVYVDAVRRSGGRAVLLPPGGDDDEASATVAGLDGLIVAGGPDIDPIRYGAARHPQTQPPVTVRDAWDLAVTSHALRLGVPLLAICRGMQVLNVCRGGTLHQHVPDLVGHARHDGPTAGYGRHQVQVSPDSMLAGILPSASTSACRPTTIRPLTCSATGSRRWRGRKTARSRRSRPVLPSSTDSPVSCSACNGTLSGAMTRGCSPRWSGPPPARGAATGAAARVAANRGTRESPPDEAAPTRAGAERAAARSTVLAPMI